MSRNCELELYLNKSFQEFYFQELFQHFESLKN